MKINIDLDLEEYDKDLLLKILETTEPELNRQLSLIAKAALYEYLEMILGSGIPPRNLDVIQHRILLLIDHYYNEIPDESTISRMLNITTAKSRSLMNTLKSVHRNKIHGKLTNKITTFIGSAVQMNDEYYEFKAQSKVIIQELNEVLEINQPGLAKFKRKTNSSGKFLLEKDSLDFLRTHFNV